MLHFTYITLIVGVNPPGILGDAGGSTKLGCAGASSEVWGGSISSHRKGAWRGRKMKLFY